MILLPDLFTLIFGQLKQIYSMILKGNFNIIVAWPHLIAIFIIVPLTIILGRFFLIKILFFENVNAEMFLCIFH